VIIETTAWGKTKLIHLNIIEAVSVYIFTIEYCLRMWSCVENPEYSRPIIGRIKFAITPFLLIDFMAIAPFFLPKLIPVDLLFLRVLRLIRVFRVLKLARYVDAIRIFYNMFSNKKEELFMTFIVGMMLMVISSCLIYHAEYNAQPDRFTSIPASFWWAVCTLTTVGYGDIYPITPLGKFLASVVAVIGIGMFALPAGILASGLMEELNKKPKSDITCPKCGHEFKE